MQLFIFDVFPLLNYCKCVFVLMNKVLKKKLKKEEKVGKGNSNFVAERYHKNARRKRY